LAHKERSSEPFVSGISGFTAKVVESNNSAASGFTAVNGRSSHSPTQPARPNGAVELSRNQSDLKQSPQEEHDRKYPILPSAAEWRYTNGNHQQRPSPPAYTNGVQPDSPHKRKRSSTDESLSSFDSSNHSRRRTDNYQSNGDRTTPSTTNHSTNRASIASLSEYSPGTSRDQVPFARHPSEGGHSDKRMAEALQREAHNMDGPSQSNGDHHPGETGVSGVQSYDPNSGIEITRAGAVVDPKKRKRVSAIVHSGEENT
jgi:hypothetical protein